MQLFSIKLVGIDKHNSRQRILLFIIVAAPEPLWFCNTVHVNWKFYSGVGLNGKDNEKLSKKTWSEIDKRNGR